MTSQPVDDATLALLLEVAGTPKPGNVDRHRDLDDLRFEAFLGGAVGAREGLELAADEETGVGRAFERGVEGMAARAGTNTQFGCLLLLLPLVRAGVEGEGSGSDLSPVVVDRVTRETTVDDAVAFYRAFEHVDVAVADPPADADDLDVRRGGDAAPALRERDVTLRDVMALSADPPDPDRVPDRNAQEWVEGFPRTFRAAEWIRSDEGPLTDRAARAFLGLLAAGPDTLIAANHGPEAAREASDRAAAMLGGADADPDALVGVDEVDAAAVHGADLDAAEELAAAFVGEGINPGTTADITCAALYVALRRGAEVAP
ncbi:triphosphoribosyl-dephospho-CoA synthase [Halorubrum salsamenti]|uniref:triphosphoribosyl-dephospho-CoA synthase n=1 Tax=Halorubrum salsamenti TaxID=2583990 RepID=UPI0011AA7DA3|nr:triphosphoribosyl-dephospho-CoA synthase [Halorubrum salsamenti]